MKYTIVPPESDIIQIIQIVRWCLEVHFQYIPKRSSDFFTTTQKSLKLLILNPLGANPTKWSNTLKEFVGKLPTNCLSVFDHFVGLALIGLKDQIPLKNKEHYLYIKPKRFRFTISSREIAILIYLYVCSNYSS